MPAGRRKAGFSGASSFHQILKQPVWMIACRAYAPRRRRNASLIWLQITTGSVMGEETR